LPYHAGLSDSVRAAHQEAFLDERADIVVATVAFGMGIDRSNIRFVLHAAMPKSVEHYQQETGRAGRDGLYAECVLLYSGGDVFTLKSMLEKSAGEAEGGIDPTYLHDELLRNMRTSGVYDMVEEAGPFDFIGRGRLMRLAERSGSGQTMRPRGCRRRPPARPCRSPPARGCRRAPAAP
jgi:superfamily II DNA helicase RecQ